MSINMGCNICKFRNINSSEEPCHTCLNGFGREKKDTDHFADTGKMIRKYRINRQKNEIEWFTLLCHYPKMKEYVVVLDMYEQPQRMWIKHWEEITITDYNEAKKALVKHLHELIESYEKEDQKMEPPIGLTPRKIHEHQVKINRFNEIHDAINRYLLFCSKIPLECIIEYNELNQCIIEYNELNQYVHDYNKQEKEK